MATILYDQTALYRAIKKLFTAPKVRRVAITAFVGDGAEAYLPAPAGIELVCWPKAGGTNPGTLRNLMKRKIEVWFADRLHMKIYWAAGRGCVIASANLSTNALGAGNLKEVGVLLPSDTIDIDQVLTSLSRYRPTEAKMRQLDRDHARFAARNKSQVESIHPSFLEWLRMPMRPDWKLGWFDSAGVPSMAAKEKANEEYGVVEPNEFLGARSGDYKRQGGEWILLFKLGKHSPAESTFQWMYCDFVVDVVPKEKKAYSKDYPCQAVQIWPVKRYPGRPFRLDNPFQRAFCKAIREYGADAIRSATSLKPPKRLIQLITRNLK